MAMVHLPDTMVDLSDTMVELHETMVDLPDSIVHFPDNFSNMLLDQKPPVHGVMGPRKRRQTNMHKDITTFKLTNKPSG